MATQLTPAQANGGNVIALTPEAERFQLRQRQARMFATSPLVPEHLRKGSPEQAMANCYIALTLAEAMGEVPLIVMQNIHVVSGKAGFASQYMIARANSSGVFRDCIDWEIEGSGKDLKVTAFATIKATGRRVEVSVDMAMAEAEGWTKNPKYRTMPEVMLRYRSAAFLVRFYAPQVMLGYHTIEEVEDVVSTGMAAAEPLTAAALLEQAIDDTPAPTGPATGSPAEAETPEAGAATASDDFEEGRDETQMGEAFNTPDDHPSRTVAAVIVSATKTAVDRKGLDRVRARHEGDIAAMPDDVRAGVEEAFRVAEGRVAA